MSSERAKQQLSRDWLYITLLNFVKLSTLFPQDPLLSLAVLMRAQWVKQLLSTDRPYITDSLYITVLSFFKLSTLFIKKDSHKRCEISLPENGLSTLVLQDLLLSWAVLMSSQRLKQLLSRDWSYFTVLNSVKFSTPLMEKGSHKQYATLTTLAVDWVFCSFRIFFWS